MATKAGLLAKSDFPLYCVKALGDRHFLVAGGGGSAKTGVSNAIEIYDIRTIGKQVVASSICRHDTGTQAVMNGAAIYDGRGHYFAAGQDDECHIYHFKYKVSSPEKEPKSDDSENASTRKRKSSGNSNNNRKASITKLVTFDVEEIKSIKTDFTKDGGFQKTVQFGCDESLLATGGGDGCLRVWKNTDKEITKLYEVNAHKSDIDDIAISPAGDRIVTVSRDNCGFVWNAKDGKKHTELISPLKASEPYRYRACRYGLIENNPDKFHLYTISIPCRRSQKPSPCYITMWDSDKFTVKKNRSAGTEVLSSMAVSDDGIYIGVGSLSGSVSVYISFSLQRLYHVREAHSIFVTGLEFMPNSEGSRALTGGQDFTLLSISADNTIRAHQAAPRGSYSVMWLLMSVVIALICLYFLLGDFFL